MRRLTRISVRQFLEVVSELTRFRTMPFVSNVDKVSGDEAKFVRHFPMMIVSMCPSLQSVVTLIDSLTCGCSFIRGPKYLVVRLRLNLLWTRKSKPKPKPKERQKRMPKERQRRQEAQRQQSRKHLHRQQG